MLENIKNVRKCKKCEKCRIKQCEMEISVKNQIDMLIFHPDIGGADVTNIYYRRAKSEILLAIPPTSTSAEWRLV